MRATLSNLFELEASVLPQVVTRYYPSIVKQLFPANATLVEIPDGCVLEGVHLKFLAIQFVAGQVVARNVPPELLPSA